MGDHENTLAFYFSAVIVVLPGLLTWGFWCSTMHFFLLLGCFSTDFYHYPPVIFAVSTFEG